MTDWPVIGIVEEWKENLTEQQMAELSKQLKIPDDIICTLEPYYENFLQRTDYNEIFLKQLENSKKSDGVYQWVVGGKLWSPEETIDIVFNPGSLPALQEYVKTVVLRFLQPHVSMKLNFTSEAKSPNNILINLIKMEKGGGSSSIGRKGGRQELTLNTDRFSNYDASTLSENGNTYISKKFVLQRYLILHEFGHAMGLAHEWSRTRCSGDNCSVEDPYSVMNYFNQGTTGAVGVKPSENCMDSYSPMDIEWLRKVYLPKSSTPQTLQSTKSQGTAQLLQKSANLDKQYDIPLNKSDKINIFSIIVTFFIILIFIILIARTK